MAACCRRRHLLLLSLVLLLQDSIYGLPQQQAPPQARQVVSSQDNRGPYDDAAGTGIRKPPRLRRLSSASLPAERQPSPRRRNEEHDEGASRSSWSHEHSGASRYADHVPRTRSRGHNLVSHVSRPVHDAYNRPSHATVSMENRFESIHGLPPEQFNLGTKQFPAMDSYLPAQLPVAGNTAGTAPAMNAQPRSTLLPSAPSPYHPAGSPLGPGVLYERDAELSRGSATPERSPSWTHPQHHIAFTRDAYPRYELESALAPEPKLPGSTGAQPHDNLRATWTGPENSGVSNFPQHRPLRHWKPALGSFPYRRPSALNQVYKYPQRPEPQYRLPPQVQHFPHLKPEIFHGVQTIQNRDQNVHQLPIEVYPSSHRVSHKDTGNYGTYAGSQYDPYSDQQPQKVASLDSPYESYEKKTHVENYYTAGDKNSQNERLAQDGPRQSAASRPEAVPEPKARDSVYLADLQTNQDAVNNTAGGGSYQTPVPVFAQSPADILDELVGPEERLTPEYTAARDFLGDLEPTRYSSKGEYYRSLLDNILSYSSAKDNITLREALAEYARALAETAARVDMTSAFESLDVLRATSDGYARLLSVLYGFLAWSFDPRRHVQSLRWELPEMRTKGQFVRGLLLHLRDSQSVPPVVRQAADVMRDYVLLDGKGAEPLYDNKPRALQTSS